MDSNDDPIYGQGFRLARRGYERLGLAGLLAHVRQKKKLAP
jgi:hypothetical protein